MNTTFALLDTYSKSDPNFVCALIVFYLCALYVGFDIAKRE